jgi:hypothetical protein
MKTAFAALILLALTACASLDQAGTASYSVKPFLAGDKAVCCEVMVNNGKEIALLDATVIKRGDDYEVRLHEEGVVAFDGQRIAAGAARTLASDAVKAAAIGGAVLIAPIAAPAVGAVLMSGTVGAAAAGVGAGVLLDKSLVP